MTLKNNATRPFYAVVGAGDLAVEHARSYARTYATDVSTRFAKVELEPKALRDQALTVVVARVDELTKDAKKVQAKLETRVSDLQTDAKALPAKVESFTNETVAELTEAYGDLATRGKDLVKRLRKQQATKSTKTATKTTVTKAKAKPAVKKTAATAKTATKATVTPAKQAAAATTEAVSNAAEKIGN